MKTCGISRHGFCLQVASYYASRPLTVLESSLDNTVSARVVGGVIKRGSFVFNEIYEPLDELNLSLSVYPNPLHQNLGGKLHAIMYQRDLGYFQLDSSGVFIPWNGEIESLVAASSLEKLKSQEELLVFSKFVPELLGLSHTEILID